MLEIKHLPRRINVIKLEDKPTPRITIIPTRAIPPLILFVSPSHKENLWPPSALKLSIPTSPTSIKATKKWITL
jgi:hypothetical protein